MKVFHDTKIIGQFRSNFKWNNPKIGSKEFKLVFRPLKSLKGTPLYVRPFTITAGIPESIKHIENILQRNKTATISP